MVRHHIILSSYNMSYISDKIRRLSQKYANGIEEHSNILMSNLMKNTETPHKLKRRFLQDLCT